MAVGAQMPHFGLQEGRSASVLAPETRVKAHHGLHDPRLAIEIRSSSCRTPAVIKLKEGRKEVRQAGRKEGRTRKDREVVIAVALAVDVVVAIY